MLADNEQVLVDIVHKQHPGIFATCSPAVRQVIRYHINERNHSECSQRRASQLGAELPQRSFAHCSPYSMADIKLGLTREGDVVLDIKELDVTSTERVSVVLQYELNQVLSGSFGSLPVW